jgi:hypothetical protein
MNNNKTKKYMIVSFLLSNIHTRSHTYKINCAHHLKQTNLNLRKMFCIWQTPIYCENVNCIFLIVCAVKWFDEIFFAIVVNTLGTYAYIHLKLGNSWKAQKTSENFLKSCKLKIPKNFWNSWNFLKFLKNFKSKSLWNILESPENS